MEDGKTVQIKVTNQAFSGIKIHKTDSTTGEGICGVTFLLYDAKQNPIGQYTSDQNGWVYINDLPTAGRYYLRELENEGYVLDTALKTVYVEDGGTALVEWKNTPICGQIQIVKKSANDNPINGLPAGTLLEGAVFGIYDKAGNTADTIKTDKNGRAVSKTLPLSRYTIRGVTAPSYYAINPTVMTAYLEYSGQIVTGSYNQQLNYKVVYKTNLSTEYRTLADNLSTSKVYVLDASPAVLGLAANERVTEVMFVFGTVKAGFAQVETPYFYTTARSGLANGTSIINVADVGGLYNGQWIQAVSRWLTTVYAQTVTTLPKTGY